MRSQSINVIVYAPKTIAEKERLAMRVSEIHAEAVLRRIKELPCTQKQKDKLLDAIIYTVRQRANAQPPSKER